MIPKTFKEVIDLGDGREISIETGKLANYINFTPNPAVTATNMETVALHGFDGKLYGIDELCSGAWGG